MNKILVDIGNTNVLFGKFNNQNEIISQLRINTSSLELNKDNNLYLKEKFKINNFLNDCSTCCISGVVPKIIISLMSLINAEHQNINCYEIDNEYLIKIINVKIKSPHEVGVDRLINSFAASQIFKPPLIIIDFGTATTFDVVDTESSYIGGLICPGVNLSIQSLANNTAKLPLIKFKKVDHLIGQDTRTAIESGLYWGYVSLVKGILSKIKLKKEFIDAKIVATGGLSSIFENDIDEIDYFEPDLTLKGLNIIDKNYDKKK